MLESDCARLEMPLIIDSEDRLERRGLRRGLWNKFRFGSWALESSSSPEESDRMAGRSFLFAGFCKTAFEDFLNLDPLLMEVVGDEKSFQK